MSRPIDALAREHAEEAVETAVQIMRDSMAKDSDRLAAIKFLAETGHGKPSQAIIAVPMTRRVAEQLYGMDREALLDIIGRPVLPAPIDAEFTPVGAPIDSDPDPLLE